MVLGYFFSLSTSNIEPRDARGLSASFKIMGMWGISKPFKVKFWEFILPPYYTLKVKTLRTPLPFARRFRSGDLLVRVSQ